jgi:ABC-type Mn2+/Zn2+ transport system permease subunit
MVRIKKLFTHSLLVSLLAALTAIGVRAVGWTLSRAFLFVPGGQAVFLYGCAMTENVATVATAAGLAAPTP